MDSGRKVHQSCTISPSINEVLMLLLVVVLTDSTNIVARKPSTVEERSDAIVNKLEVLDQRLASKVCRQDVLNQYATLF